MVLRSEFLRRSSRRRSAPCAFVGVLSLNGCAPDGRVMFPHRCALPLAPESIVHAAGYEAPFPCSGLTITREIENGKTHHRREINFSS